MDKTQEIRKALEDWSEAGLDNMRDKGHEYCEYLLTELDAANKNAHDFEEIYKQEHREKNTLKRQLDTVKQENERLRHRDKVVSLANETLGRYVREGKVEILDLRLQLKQAMEALELIEKRMDVWVNSAANEAKEIARKALLQIKGKGESLE